MLPAQDETAEPTLVNLRKMRLLAALSQRDLADRAGVAHTTIIRLERGNPHALPSTVRKLARALHVKPSELLG
jgi:transcriptional regulator with XRE-family HTH domain